MDIGAEVTQLIEESRITCLRRGQEPSPYSGNCKICTQDEKNKECKMYTPITIGIYYVRERDYETTK